MERLVATLRYYPNITDEEQSVALGAVYSDDARNERWMVIWANWRAVESIEPDVDIQFLDKYIQGMQDEIGEIASDDELSQYLRLFVNELRFVGNELAVN